MYQKPFPSISTGAPLGATATASTNVQPKPNIRFEEQKEKARTERRALSTEILKAIIQRSDAPKDETELAKMAVAQADALLHVLQTTEEVKNKLNHEG